MLPSSSKTQKTQISGHPPCRCAAWPQRIEGSCARRNHLLSFEVISLGFELYEIDYVDVENVVKMC